MIGTTFSKPLNEELKTEYRIAAAWCNETQSAVIEDKGEYFEVVAIPEPTEEQQQEALVNKYKSMIQAWMDAEAVKLGYDNLLTACTYMNTGVVKFDAEGEGFRQWRSAVWATGYALIDEVLSGQRDIPADDADVIALLPSLNIVYPEVTDGAESD